MTPLESARHAFDVARETYRSALADELARLGAQPQPVTKRPMPPPPQPRKGEAREA